MPDSHLRSCGAQCDFSKSEVDDSRRSIAIE